MRILTVRQPWAWAIIHGGKDVENRVRNIAGTYRGPVAIHAALADDPAASENETWEVLADAMRTRQADWDVRGAIIGVVDLVDVHPSNDERCERFQFFGGGSGICSDWAELGVHHLEFANPRALDEPIPYKGALGLRNLVVNDPVTTAQILAQIGATA